MISLAQFLKLKRGDVVLYGRNKTPRIVEIGPANYDPPGFYVTFRIMRRSWTGRGLTVYSGEIRKDLALPRGKLSKKTIREIENLRLSRAGFDVSKEEKRELREFKRRLKINAGWGIREFKCSPGHRWSDL